MHSIHGRAPAIATGLATHGPISPSGWSGRRRRALDRRQPPHPRAAPERQPQHPALQQPDLRPHEGPVLAHLRARKGHEVDADGLGRPAVQPARVAIGSEATFVARAIDTDKKELTEVLRAAAEHRGASFVEIFQNCNIYNDGAFDFVREQKENRIYLKAGEPIVWGEKGVRQADDGSAEVVAATSDGLLVHDPATSSRASPSPSRGSRARRWARRPSESSARSSGPCTTRAWRSRSRTRASTAATATCRRSSTAGDTWTIA